MKNSHQAQLEISHVERGSWEPSGVGFGLHGSGQGAGGRPVSNEYMREQEDKFSLKNRNVKAKQQFKVDKKNNERNLKIKEISDRLDHAKDMLRKYQDNPFKTKETEYFKKLISELEST
ncbi:hypothetical protein [Shewanella phaeophyticola]|uniref:Uncharacterized protein n=1 Tax=Shewanella phaeophyticola TaxID=2978345 RepID=A0ABT2P6L4_9GAMM|nr:hypothetical protein [Shewanella sp. KJ10-1]MCT8988305.1 hypothetical protein [Shewanella sp. KJ10-1]